MHIPSGLSRDLKLYDPDLSLTWDERRQRYAVLRWRKVWRREPWNGGTLSYYTREPALLFLVTGKNGSYLYPDRRIIGVLRKMDPRRFPETKSNVERNEGFHKELAKKEADAEEKRRKKLSEDLVDVSKEVHPYVSGIEQVSVV